MKWPWQGRMDDGTLVLGGMPGRLLWVHAAAPLGRAGAVRGCGVIEHAVADSAAAAQALRALHLPLRNVVAVLPLQQAQFLQIEAPTVPADELRAAARWRVKDLVEGRLEDLTIDVMNVGDGRAKAARQIFVAAARSQLIRELGLVAHEAGLALTVVDVAEAAQRNLQTAYAATRGMQARATAALMLHGTQCLLTICVGDELFHARRLDADAGALADSAGRPALAASEETAFESVDFVDYGAEPDGRATDSGAPRLVVELQRSFDLWERTWPDLPLAGLFVNLGPATARMAAAIESAVGLHVEALDAQALFAGFAGAAPEPELQLALLPLLGALLRAETTEL